MSSSSHDHAAHDHADEHDHDDGQVHVHVHPIKFYIAIFMALVTLTLVTIGAARLESSGLVHLGSASILVAVIIATIKAGLVATFFMHLKEDKVFNTILFLGSFLFLTIFLLLTREDLSHRGQLDTENGVYFLPATGEQAPGALKIEEVQEVPHGAHAAAKADEKAVDPKGAAAGASEKNGHMGGKPEEKKAH